MRPAWERVRRWVPSWLLDPPRVLRLLVASALSITVAVLATLAVVATVTSYKSAQTALHTRDDTAARASARIGQLSDQIAALSGRAEANSIRIGELIAEVNALEEQVRQMGGQPVASEPRTTSPTTTTTVPTNPPASAGQAPSPAPEPATTTTTAPPPPTTPPPTTAPCTSLPVVGCVGTKASRSSTRNDVQSTAYCLTGNMASGRPTYVGAVAGNQWPLGTVLNVSDSPWGPGQFTVEDRIGFGSELDFAIPGDCAAATQWGRRSVTTEVIS